MTVPMRDRAKVFDAITATETKGLHTVGLGQNQYAGAILLEVVGASSPSWTLDIQGRVHESGTYANIDYVRHFQGGAAALANAQLTVDFTTARYYLVPNPPQFVQLVATRTAGSLTIYASYISLAFAQWLLTTARGAVYVEGPAAENAAVAGQPLLVGGRYDVSDRTLGDGDVGAVGLTVKGFVKAVNPDGTNIGGTGGTSHTDDAAFTPATDDGTVAFAVADETSPDSVDEGDAGGVRMSLDRILYTRPEGYSYASGAINISADGTTTGTILSPSRWVKSILANVGISIATAPNAGATLDVYLETYDGYGWIPIIHWAQFPYDAANVGNSAAWEDGSEAPGTAGDAVAITVDRFFLTAAALAVSTIRAMPLGAQLRFRYVVASITSGTFRFFAYAELHSV